MRFHPLFLAFVAVFFAGAALAAQDGPTALNPIRQVPEGYMFDWIFFAIMIPIPLFFYLEMIRNR